MNDGTRDRGPGTRPDPGFITGPLPAEFPPVIPTANDYVALPDIAPDGSIGSIQLVSMRAQGLVGFTGRPLLRPIAGDLDLKNPTWERVDGWIPRFRWTASGTVLTETILTPVGHKGFVVVLEIHSRGGAAALPLGLQVAWERTTYTLFHERPLPVTVVVRPDPWTKSVAMEALAGLPVAAWGVHAEPEVELPAPQRTEDPVGFRLAREVTLARGERAAVAFYVGVGMEADGARTTAVDLRRRGWEALLAETRGWLQARRPTERGRLADLCHLNQLFNRFFACGRAIDTEDSVWITSRSPRYYVSAAFWSRDAFLWSLPGLLLIDPGAAREAILYAFRTQWRNAGMHAQYLGGGIIYPGFELDELAAFPVGLGMYLRNTGDASIIGEHGVMDALLDFPRRLAAWRGDTGLFRTFLDPSDDPVQHPYLTYDNVLAWRGLLDATDVFDRLEREDEAQQARTTARKLEAAIWRHCAVEGPPGPMFAWAVDDHGGFELYDDPPGSLILLPYYGFCRPDHPTYVNTTAWVRSPANPWYVNGRFAAPASAHAPDPWPMAIANDLLVDRAEGLAWLDAAEMDGGIACETVGAQTGKVKTGAAFATFAGVLAAALAQHRTRWPR